MARAGPWVSAPHAGERLFLSVSGEIFLVWVYGVFMSGDSFETYSFVSSVNSTSSVQAARSPVAIGASISHSSSAGRAALASSASVSVGP